VKCDEELVISRIFHVLIDDYFIVEQLWGSVESPKRTIEIQLNAHEERLNRRTMTSKTMAFKTQVKTSKTNNGDDKKKKKNDD